MGPGSIAGTNAVELMLHAPDPALLLPTGEQRYERNVRNARNGKRRGMKRRGSTAIRWWDKVVSIVIGIGQLEVQFCRFEPWPTDCARPPHGSAGEAPSDNEMNETEIWKINEMNEFLRLDIGK